MDNKKIDIVNAIYTEQKISEYKNNPLIEALPEIIDNPIKMAKQLTRYPQYNKDDLNLPAMYRIHLVKEIERFFKPLSTHYAVEQIISRLMRYGYVNRNPFIFKNNTTKYEWQKYPTQGVSSSTTPELGIFGISGIGKTTLVKNILSMYPQVILHTDYKGDKTVRYQITWLHVETPASCTSKGLCLNLLSQIDEIFGENVYYRKGANKNSYELLNYIKTVVQQHSIGLLVFDELQNLRGIEGKKQEQLLNFFVEISNTLQVPIVFIGTLKAIPLFNREFRNARRICGDEIVIWNRIEKDAEWKAFVTELFKFQYTKNHVEINDELINLLYEESQGITDVVLKLFMLAQYRAISSNHEKITKGVISSVAKECLKPIKPMLDALKKNDENLLSQYQDIYLSKKNWDDILNSEQNKALIYGNGQKTLVDVEKSNEFIINNKLTTVSAWLIQGGFSMRESEIVATEVVEKFGADTDVNILNRQAYQLLLSKKDLQQEEKLLRDKEKNNIKQPTGMLKIYDEAIQAKMPVYETLKNSNYIADINEFIS
ncbi:ATP-binding protein [Candidatus Clostridium stratigraminis]|uniref:ATP-binding protein n=1 Tax=Candidatus Clostridium stratigraminis TaxID=3381661 RepID=A0ABW8T8H7_9CLOT